MDPGLCDLKYPVTVRVLDMAGNSLGTLSSRLLSMDAILIEEDPFSLLDDLRLLGYPPCLLQIKRRSGPPIRAFGRILPPHNAGQIQRCPGLSRSRRGTTVIGSIRITRLSGENRRRFQEFLDLERYQFLIA